ncbi:hypothetical protein SeLEV6574_g08566 [Synchytrium endobioticum]|uniref:Uncharacterized protein n=1 Tax=Synchytrium endobioticum TaxID=286115 RepID=A0A507BZ26_9FUNG|nr:hypothetical protein SeLEV6574_g08566 [Synchytrium endobioticum]
MVPRSVQLCTFYNGLYDHSWKMTKSAVPLKVIFGTPVVHEHIFLRIFECLNFDCVEAIIVFWDCQHNGLDGI